MNKNFEMEDFEDAVINKVYVLVDGVEYPVIIDYQKESSTPVTPEKLNKIKNTVKQLCENQNASITDKILNTNSNSTENTYSCDYINNITKNKVNVLWTNPSPANNFEVQTINLSDSDYDYLIINFRNNDKDGESTIVKKGQNAKLAYVVYDSGFHLFERTAKYVDDTTYQFLDGKQNGTAKNWLCVPIEIIAVKL